MSNSYEYGTHRCIEPKNSFPDSAWKIDNDTKIYKNEILIDVTILNIDDNSFKQIYVECEGDTEKIKYKILEIIKIRGKLHNPITGTGGILFGKVIEIGSEYQNNENLKIGDYIISLSSLALTPLRIEKIINVDINAGQVEIKGKAIFFANSPLIKAPKGLPIKLLLAVLDEAGAAIQCFKIVKPNDKVLVLGASSEIGLMCGYALRKKLGDAGKLVGIRSKNGDRNFSKEVSTIFDEIYYVDVLNPIETFKEVSETEDEFDLTINCINAAGSEMLSILCTKEEGTIYLASLGSNYKTLCLSVEGMAKDLNIIAYKGYTKGHAHFTIDLLKDNPKLLFLLKERLEKNYKKDSIGNKLTMKSNIESNLLKDINLQEYIFNSLEMQKVLDNGLKVANFDCTVLITGESGVGKEIIAKVIHKSSERNYMPSIKINCGSIPKNLLESELFGYEKAAFTGADKNGKLGFFEIANGGTLFLDEIGEMPLDLQVKLLRAIQEKEIYRVGGTTPIKIDVRILAATNKNLKTLVESGNFREDLYYRLNVFPIEIPPLRNRKSDILPLTKHFIDKYNDRFKLNKTIDALALDYLLEYNWPGNIRELENMIQRLLITSETSIISASQVAKILHVSYEKSPEQYHNTEIRPLQEILDEREYEILKVAKEKLITTRKIAAALGLSQTTLVRKLNKYKL